MKAKWAGCSDDSEHCGHWARTGECERNPAYMKLSCRLACKLCNPAAAKEMEPGAPDAPLAAEAEAAV